MKALLAVVNYRTPADLQSCIESFLTYPPDVDCSVYIVNVDPQPDDTAVARSYLSEGIDVVEVYSNIGYARAINLAGSLEDADVKAAFNADVEFRPGVVDACVDALKENEDWGVVGPRQVDRSGRIVHAGIFRGPDKPYHRGWMEKTSNYRDFRSDCWSLSGSALFTRSSCWEELTACSVYQRQFDKPIGPWSNLQLFHEDEQLCRHAVAHGWKCGFVGSHTMVHALHGSVDKYAPLSPGSAGCLLLDESEQRYVAFCKAHGMAWR